jgi:hypothetical protein
MLHQQPTFGSYWTSSFQMGQFYMFSLLYNVTSDDLWHRYVTFDLINICGSYIPSHLPSHVIIHIPELPTIQMGQVYITTWPQMTWYVTFDLINISRFPCYINNPHLVPIGLQLFKWAYFTCSAYYTTWPQMTFDLINMCIIYIPSNLPSHFIIRILEL